MNRKAMARPLAQYLVRFDGVEDAEARGETYADLPAPSVLAQPPAGNVASLIQAAHEEGRAEGLAAASAACAAEIANEKLIHEAALSRARAAWVSEEGMALSEKVTMAFSEIEAGIAASAARVMRPFLAERLRLLAVEQLVQHIRVLLSGDEQPAVRINGPQDLLSALRERIPNAAAGIVYAPSESIDVEVLAGQTIIDSRIEAWMERIQAIPE